MGVDILGIGKSGLAASKKSLQTTGHNIANANTEGYSRQNVRLETGNPIGEGNVVTGSGVSIKDIKRVHDELVEKRLNGTLSGHKFNEERTLQMTQLEDLFNEIDSNGLNHILNKFFNSFRELATQPENETTRSIVRENARVVINDFHRAREGLNNLSSNIDKKLAASVEDINLTLDSIANLNIKITQLETTHSETGDLRDQRDLAVKTLAEYFSVNVYSDEKGRFNVAAEGVGTLVSGGQYQELMSGYSNKDDPSANSSGSLEIYFKSRPSQSITGNINSGSMGALLKTKNSDIKKQMEQMDEIAFELVHTVNAVHRRGFAHQGGIVNLNGDTLPEGTIPLPKTGINFFKEPLDKFRASEYLSLSDDVMGDLNNIATGLEPNQPGDNRVAIAISKLQHEKVLQGGTTNFEETYLKSMADIGLQAGKAKIDTDQSAGILAQAKALKERISGVSLDEETANMVKFQHAYEASARMMKTADEMFKSVLGMMN